MKSSTNQLILTALREDVISRDITSIAVFGNGGGLRKGIVLAKQDLVLSGLEVAKEVFKEVSRSIRFVSKKKNGDYVKKGQVIAEVSGFVSDLLRAERVMLNFLQHLSGVATLTNQFVQAIKPYRAKILDTRKTIPGLRYLEKKAVCDGGGHNHRMNLSDMFLVKDNHIDACGGVSQALERVKEFQRKKQESINQKLAIEIEVRNIHEVRQVLKSGADIILLDNMNLRQIRQAVREVSGKCLLEVSGGVNLKNVRKIAATGVSRISIGALTHSVPAVDISFEIKEPC